MKREYFKEILPTHIEICKRIIKDGNDCEGVKCEECPFSIDNATNKLECNKNQYRRYSADLKIGGEKTVVRSAKRFIELFEKDFQPNIEEAIDSTTEFLRENLKETEVPDNVHQPKHYKLDGLDIEVIDVIKSLLTPEQLKGYLHGNVIKYILRSDKKNGVEDLEKAKVYLEWLIEAKRG